MIRTIQRFLRVKRHQLRTRLLEFDWYKRRFAGKLIENNLLDSVRQVVELEEVLYKMGPTVCPILIKALKNKEREPEDRIVLLRILGALAEPGQLPFLEQQVGRAGGEVKQAAQKALILTCQRLAKRGELPEGFRRYLN